MRISIISMITLAALGLLRNAGANHDFQQDACLNDVSFVNVREGWAVGNQGTILHTNDGGRSWRIQSSNIDRCLESVCFVDSKRGWAVGGFSVPVTYRSSAIILHTDDGGKHWNNLDSRMIPWLSKVTFFDSQHGYVIGQRSNIYPAGIFTTKDGGRSWLPIQGKLIHDCVAGELDSRRNGFVVDTAGKIVAIKNGRVQGPQNQDFEPVCLNLKMLDQNSGMGCGADGTILLKFQGASEWVTHPSRFAGFNFSEIECVGESRWIAGEPGSFIFRSIDGGQKWQRIPTHQDLPITGLSFVDQMNGWAVGSLGLILHTRDGGKTWKAQRGANRRAAILCVYSDPNKIPWKWLAKNSAFDGFRSILVLVQHPEKNRLAKTRISQRCAEALQHVGGSQQIVHVLSPGQSSEDLKTELTNVISRHLRIWKPSLLLMHQPDALSDVASVAKIQASDSANALTALLPTWNVPSLGFESMLENSIQGAPDQLVVSLGEWTSELADRVTYYLDSVQSIDRRFRVQHDGKNWSDISDTRALVGTAIGPNTLGNRRPRTSLPKDYKAIQQRAQQRRNVRSMIGQKHLSENFQPAQLIELAKDIHPYYRADILYQLARRAESTGDYRTAEELLTEIVFEYSNHDLSEAAAIEFTHLVSSEEIAIAKASNDDSVAQVNAVVQLQAESAKDVRPVDVQRQQKTRPIQNNVNTNRLELIKKIQGQRPSLFFDNAIRFSKGALNRRLGKIDESANFYKSQLNTQSDFVWRACASTEVSLSKLGKSQMVIKPRIECRAASRPPLLDGNLDDDLWQRNKPLGMGTKDERAKALVWLSYDRQFLYLAAACPKSAKIDYSGKRETRQRDADLSGQDRVEIAIDTDRDYSTFWNLTVDSRGWGAESIRSNETWNPVWYIAPGSNSEAWFFEAAIPIDQLSTKTALAGETWSINVRRVTPGEPTHAWVRSPSGGFTANSFGLLQFTER